ncbi:MAG: hypothetical protein WBP12_01885 [Candidatus Saccharimonas sp.]
MIFSAKSRYIVTISREGGTDEFDVRRFVEEAHQSDPWISRHPESFWHASNTTPSAFDMIPANKLLVGEVSAVLGRVRATATITTHPKYYINSEMMYAYRNYARRVGSAVRQQPYVEDVRLSITYEMVEIPL